MFERSYHIVNDSWKYPVIATVFLVVLIFLCLNQYTYPL